MKSITKTRLGRLSQLAIANMVGLMLLVAFFLLLSDIASVKAQDPAPAQAGLYHPFVRKGEDGSTTVYVNNVGSSPAGIMLSYYDITGTLVCTVPNNIPVLGMQVFPQSSESCLGTSFRGSLVVQSDELVASVVTDEDAGPMTDNLGSYIGSWEGTGSRVVPVSKNWIDAERPDIFVQNTSTTTANFLIDFYAREGFLEYTWGVGTIQPKSSTIVDLLGLPVSIFNGSAFVLADQPVVAVARTTDYYRGMPWLQNDSDDMSNSRRLARVAKHYDLFNTGVLWSTMIEAINASDSNSAITVEYRDITGTLVFSRSNFVSSRGKVTQYLGDETGLPDTFFGSAYIYSSQAVAVSEVTLEDGLGPASVAFASYAPSSDSPLSLPKVVRDLPGRFTAFSLHNTQNMTANVNIWYYDPSGIPVLLQPDTLPPYATHHYNQYAQTALGTSFTGSVKFESDQSLVAIVDEVRTDRSVVLVIPGEDAVLTNTCGGLTTTIQIPGNAVISPTVIVFTATTQPVDSNPPAGFDFVGRNFTLSALENGQQVPFSSTVGVTITLAYSQPLPEDISPDTLRLYRWNTDVAPPDWVDAACDSNSYDRSTVGILKVRVCHFSGFALAGNSGHVVYLPVVLKQ
jgi:hypothetical protein